MVTIDENNIKNFLFKLGFEIKSGAINTYFKKYSDYEIVIEIKSNFKHSSINYGDKITIGRKTTSNFSQQENFVILECVNKLLEKGYNPEKIILEKDFPVGHREKGALDIQVLDENNKSYLMIECKTWAKEYKKEKNNMYDNGGQLFTYYIQDKDTKFLCLYTSVFEDDEIIYENSIIKVRYEMRDSSNSLECFENWIPQIFEEVGIFEEQATAYNIVFKGLTKKELKPLTKENGGDIFNRFAEILRRNVVSDKTNAYNKIFNLFLCKIVDEYERNNTEKLKFQWEDSETNEEVLLRLNELYKQGMKEYLDLDISSVDIEEIELTLAHIKSEGEKQKLKNLFIEQKLYTSNDFAFKEVFDKKTFDLNCIVVKEVVKLLEKYKIKYETKQQFLGDFFEKLLNTGIKQEVGQYFTPVPIAQFICKSLPIWKIIYEKNKSKNNLKILPYCIDYSSGSGHFLTEVMEEINYYVENKIDDNFIENNKAKIDFNANKKYFRWAGEYIYGIEKDYRLAKTTKIATFLNGDGDANIIFGDGLDNFYKSKDYKNKLKISSNSKNNEIFDVIVANPPYSVSGFKTTLFNGRESFDLFDDFTDKSKEIECLFIERTNQLLREGGVAGIVLPTSIIEGEKIYAKTREIILDNFDIKGIIKLGKNTFMATNTATIILFLQKKKNIKEEILFYLKKSISEKKDFSINNIEKPIEKYLSGTYKIDLKTYLEFFTNEDLKNENLLKTKIFKKYLSEFKKQTKTKKINDFIKERELNKLLYFITTFNQKVVIYNLPTNSTKKEQKILGYKFSDRKGYEGINIFNLGGELYDTEDLYNNNKLNSYVLNNFEKNEINSPTLKGVHYVPLNEIINFEDINCSKVISVYKFDNKSKEISSSRKNVLLKIKREKITNKISELLEKYKKHPVEIKPLTKLISQDMETGGTPHTRNQDFWKNGTINWLKIGDIDDKFVNKTELKITEAGQKDKNLKIYSEGTILYSIFGTIGKIGILNIKSTLNQAICSIVPDNNIVDTEYLYYLLMYETEKIASSKIHRTQDNINKTKLEKLELPIYKELKIQKEFVKEILEFEKTLN